MAASLGKTRVGEVSIGAEEVKDTVRCKIPPWLVEFWGPVGMKWRAAGDVPSWELH